MKYCTKCGKPNEDESRFCSSCGEKFIIDEPKQFNDNVIAGDVDMSTHTHVTNNYNSTTNVFQNMETRSFHCRVCGTYLEVSAKASTAICDKCNTPLVVPKIDDDKRANLYDRANHFLRNKDFDKAIGIYEQILNVDNTDAEAYWSIVLCKYGIEYVDDPETSRIIPTCHRASYDPIVTDDDYQSAIKYANREQKELYEAQAKEIDRVQKDILALAQKEENYDVFICYKETDENGQRTKDSYLAGEIYHQLTQRGFKVFYAAITMENKLGFSYEPIIFAALHSAKVMLVVGSKIEYFNAVWVKNEWSRYLKLISKDRSKVLIPCYTNMTAYDLPDEFAHLQAQDMSKIGFIEDVIHGIQKIVPKENPDSANSKANNTSKKNSATIPLLKRAFLFLEDGDWNNANVYCEKVLDQDPENAEAYLGKLLVELHVKKQEQLKNCAEPFDNNSNYQKAFRFGNDELRAALTEYLEHIAIRKENEQLERIYQKALNLMAKGNSTAYNEATALFASIKHYKDAEKQAVLCEQKAIKAAEAEQIRRTKLKTARNRNIKYIIISACVLTVIIFIILVPTVIIPGAKYNSALKLMDDGKYSEAIENFKGLDGFADSLRKTEECKYGEASALLDDKKFAEAKAVFKDIDDDYINCDKEIDYCNAFILLSDGKLTESYNTFESLENFKDSKDQRDSIRWRIEKEYFTDIKVGSSVFFGIYEQDNFSHDYEEFIEWIVLDIVNGKALVISKYALDYQKFDEVSKDNTSWENCTLRQWLNGEFINTAFSFNEKTAISHVTVTAHINPNYPGVDPGNDTRDKIFLLSTQETNKYFNSDEERICFPTYYALAQGLHTPTKGNGCLWWTRSPSYARHSPAIVNQFGYNTEWGPISIEKEGIRPAMWIDLSLVQ